MSDCGHGVVVHKPLLKWIGGKTQIITTILDGFPKDIQNYHEVFLGGGSVLFALLSYVKAGIITVHGEICAYDVNQPLIHFYKNVQCDHVNLYTALQTCIREYKECDGTVINRNPVNLVEAKQSKESYYYWTRKCYNNLTLKQQTSVYGSALFLFLNKTCFRGIFRVGPNGFNVPFGHYDNPEIVNKQHLEDLHTLITDVHFEVYDFSESLQCVSDGDFVYLDPPYAPCNSDSFVRYTVNGFRGTHHISLFDMCTNLAKNNIQLMMSNSDVPLVRDAFQSSKFSIKSVSCKRCINSKKPGSKSNEVVITNY